MTKDHWEQLMLNEWLPATMDRPKTACTFRTLETFHMLSHRGKITAYDFYTSLEKLTDNIGGKQYTVRYANIFFTCNSRITKPIRTSAQGPRFKSRYLSFLRLVRQWRHLKELKRGGRGNDGVRKVIETFPGELAVKCIACPTPGVNLPEGWENAPPEMRYYFSFYSCRALFKILL